MKNITKPILQLKGMTFYNHGDGVTKVITENDTSLVYPHDIIAGDDLVFFTGPRYTTKIKFVLQTKHRAVAEINALERSLPHTQSVTDVVKTIQMLSKISAHTAMNKLLFKVDNTVKNAKYTLNTKNFKAGISSYDIPVTVYLCQSADSAHIDSDMAAALYAMHLLTVYQQMKKMAEGLKTLIGNSIEGYKITIYRVFKPHQIDDYLTPEAMGAMRCKNPLLAETAEIRGFPYRLNPKYMYEYFGGQCDCQSFMSQEWIRISKLFQ